MHLGTPNRHRKEDAKAYEKIKVTLGAQNEARGGSKSIWLGPVQCSEGSSVVQFVFPNSVSLEGSNRG